MFLSAGVLTEEERQAAFAAVPEMEPLRFNRNISLNLIDGEALKTIDGIAGPYAREACAAYADGAFLLLRVAGLVAESKAAVLFCKRLDPAGWIRFPGDVTLTGDQPARLRLSLEQLPLEAAAMYLEAGLNHIANAVLRFAFEAGFDSAELKKLGLDVKKPATPEGSWTSWEPMARQLEKLEIGGAAVARFVLAQALMGCHRDPDVQAVSAYRDLLVHRGVPGELSKPVIDRTSEWASGSLALHFPPKLAPAELPDLEDTRGAISRALTKCRELEDRTNDFLPRWSEHVGFEIRIEGVTVAIAQKIKPSFVIPGAPSIIVPSKPRKQTLHFHGTTQIRAHAQRDFKLFMR
jgi:hypothetical protein